MILVLLITSKLIVTRAEFPALTTMKLLIFESVNLGLTEKKYCINGVTYPYSDVK